MITQKAVVFGLIGMTGLLLALAFRSFAAAAASALLLFFVLLGLVGGPSALTANRPPARERLFEGDRRPTSLEVENRGALPSGFLDIYDVLPSKVKVQKGRNGAFTLLGARQGLRSRYTLETPLRGHHTLGPVKVREEDILGLQFHETTIDSFQDIEVLPYAEKVEEFAAQARRIRPFPGPVTFRQPGEGTEFYGIRDYVKGDPLRRINWKVYARRRKLMVNEFEKEALSHVMVIVDAREVNTYGTLSCNPLEYSVKAASSLVRYFIARREQVGLITYGKETTAIEPSCGHGHLDRMLAQLTCLEGGGATPFGDAIKFSMPYISPGTAIVIITGLEFDKTLRPKLVELFVSGFPLILISPRPFDFEGLATSASALKQGLLLLERNNYMDSLKWYGIDVVEWTPDMNLLELIQRCERVWS